MSLILEMNLLFHNSYFSSWLKLDTYCSILLIKQPFCTSHLFLETREVNSSEMSA